MGERPGGAGKLAANTRSLLHGRARTGAAFRSSLFLGRIHDLGRIFMNHFLQQFALLDTLLGNWDGILIRMGTPTRS